MQLIRCGEINEISATSSNYIDSALNPETNYRYRIACADTNGNRSAYSAETNVTAEEVANLVVYISSLLSSATNGAALRVDGGTIQSCF